jgi:hypothetical protein
MILKDWIKSDYCVGWFANNDRVIERNYDAEIVREYSACRGDGDFRASPFKHRHVASWVIVRNKSGALYACAFNENPNTGWSYPIKRFRGEL